MSLMGRSPVVTHCSHFIRKHLSVCLCEVSRTRLLALMLISNICHREVGLKMSSFYPLWYFTNCFLWLANCSVMSDIVLGGHSDLLSIKISSVHSWVQADVCGRCGDVSSERSRHQVHPKRHQVSHQLTCRDHSLQERTSDLRPDLHLH